MIRIASASLRQEGLVRSRITVQQPRLDTEASLVRPMACFRWAGMVADRAGISDDVIVAPRDLLSQYIDLQDWGLFLDSDVELSVRGVGWVAATVGRVSVAWVRLGRDICVQSLGFRCVRIADDEYRQHPDIAAPPLALSLEEARDFSVLKAYNALRDRMIERFPVEEISAEQACEAWTRFLRECEAAIRDD